MKRSTKIITATVLTLGVVGGAAAIGKHRFGSPEARIDYMMGYVSEELRLDSGQEQALEVLKDEVLNARTLMKDQMTPMRDEISTLLNADSFNQAAALEMITEQTATINELAPGLVMAFGNFLDGLDAEQKAEVVEFIEKRAEHRRGRHGKRHGDYERSIED